MSRKKMNLLVAGIAVLLVFAGVVLLTQMLSQSEDNLFPGRGELKQAKRLNGLGAVYNEDYIFLQSYENVTHRYYRLNISDMKLDRKKKIEVNCRDASCTHDSIACEAYVNMGEYFVFQGRLYKADNEERLADGTVEYRGYILDVESGKEVFSNTIPDDMPEEMAVDDSRQIYYVRVLSDDLIKVEGHSHTYLLDGDFCVRYQHYDVGKFPWGAVFGEDYYYVDDAYQMVKVNLNTGESVTLDILGKVFMGDNDENYIYYSNEFEELYRFSPADMGTQKIADEVSLFSVQDNYIYAFGGRTGKKVIYDRNGNQIADYTGYENMGADSVFQIGDKIYNCMEGGVAYMDEDGTNYGELTR